MDFEEEKYVVEAFLAEQGYSEPSFLRTGKDKEFILGIHQDWTGVLPATFVYSQNGSLADFWQGASVDYETLKERVIEALHP